MLLSCPITRSSPKDELENYVEQSGTSTTSGSAGHQIEQQQQQQQQQQPGFGQDPQQTVFRSQEKCVS